MSCDQPTGTPIHFFRQRPGDLLPFKVESPNLVLEQLDHEYSYAFNYKNPSGVVLLRGVARRQVENYIENRKLDADFLHSGSESSLVLKRLLEEKSSAVEKTLNFWIHITDSCNLGCYYCYIDDVDKYQATARQAMSLETAQVILERIRTEMLIQSITRVHFKFAGGEPFLAQESMEQFCRLADSILPLSDFQVSFGAITNGLLLTNAAITFVKKRGISISISLDGSEELHNKTRYLRSGNKRLGTWQAISSNIDLLLSNDITPYILHTVSASNIGGLSEFQSFLSRKNIGFRLSLVRLGTPPSDSSTEKFRNAIVDFYESLPENFPLHLRIERDARFAEWNPSRSKQLACGSARNYFSIDSMGKLASCQMAANRPLANLMSEEMQVGRINATSRLDTQILATPSLRNGGCSDCYFRSTCAGGCPQHTLSVSGTMSHPSPWCSLYGTLYPVYVRAIAKHRLKVLKSAGKAS